MSETTPLKPQGVQRFFEQGPDAISFYSDLIQVVHTGNEIVLQLYETIPGAPGPNGLIQSVRTRLRATITTSAAHALNFANNLLKNLQSQALTTEPEK